MPYDFEIGFQRRLLAAALADETFFKRARGLVRPAYFTDEVLAGVAESAFEIHEHTGALPDLPILLEDLKTRVAPGRKWGEYAEEARRVWKLRRAGNLDFYRDRARDFARRQALADAVGEAREYLEAGELDRVAATIDRALQVGGAASSAYDHLAGFEERLLHYTGQANGDTVPRVPSGIPPMDERMRGGLGPGEVGCFVALAGHGKSTFLVNAGVAALLHGTSVLHFTLENSQAIVSERYDVRLLGRPINRVAKFPRKYRRRMEKLVSTLKARLEIRYYPSDMLTLNELEADIAASEGVGLVIVDYAALMKIPAKQDEERHRLAALFRGLRRAAGQAGVPIWTAHQSNRPGMGARLIGMQHLSECFEIAAIVDVAASGNYDESSGAELPIYVMKNRLGKTGFEVPCIVDWETATIRAAGDEES